MNEDYSTKQHTAKERYEKLKEKREQYLDRARECSELTIPALIPEDGFHYTSELYTPFQSEGISTIVPSSFIYFFNSPSIVIFPIPIGVSS